MKQWIWEHTEGFICGVIVVSLIWVISSFGETPVIPEPEIITVTEYVEVPHYQIIERVIEKVVVKTVEVPVEKVVERIKEITIKPEYFKTENELREWVENNHGFFNIGNSLLTKHDKNNDCEDQADRWQKRALEDGYIVSIAPVYYNRVFDTKVTDGKYPYHVGLWTSIGNDYFYWEPVTGEITKLKVVRD